jgi:hypothetical protein
VCEVTTSVPEYHVNGMLEGLGRLLSWQAADSDWSVRPPPPPNWNGIAVLSCGLVVRYGEMALKPQDKFTLA